MFDPFPNLGVIVNVNKNISAIQNVLNLINEENAGNDANLTVTNVELSSIEQRVTPIYTSPYDYPSITAIWVDNLSLWVGFDRLTSQVKLLTSTDGLNWNLNGLVAGNGVTICGWSMYYNALIVAIGDVVYYTSDGVNYQQTTPNGNGTITAIAIRDDTGDILVCTLSGYRQVNLGSPGTWASVGNLPYVSKVKWYKTTSDTWILVLWANGYVRVYDGGLLTYTDTTTPGNGVCEFTPHDNKLIWAGVDSLLLFEVSALDQSLILMDTIVLETPFIATLDNLTFFPATGEYVCSSFNEVKIGTVSCLAVDKGHRAGSFEYPNYNTLEGCYESITGVGLVKTSTGPWDYLNTFPPRIVRYGDVISAKRGDTVYYFTIPGNILIKTPKGPLITFVW